jgi:hypothetical protein
VHLVIGNCVKVFDTLDDMYPDLHWECANANPPFGKKWKLADGSTMDSTEWTWKLVTKRANYGYFISNHNTITKLGIDKHPWVFDYKVHDGLSLWKHMRDTLKIGVVCWKNPTPKEATDHWDVKDAWENIGKVVEHEKIARPPFNIYLDPVSGYLRTYLSVRSELKLKLSRDQILRLQRIDKCHPITLTTEKETRDLLRELVIAGFYTVQPDAKKSVEDALSQVDALSAPIMDVTPYETVAWSDEEDKLVAKSSAMNFTAGKSYPITTGTYRFTDKLKRTKLHFSESTMTQHTATHDCTQSGMGRYIQVVDDLGDVKRFMDRPVEPTRDCDEGELWKVFHMPKVKTIADQHPEAIEQNLAIMKSCELIAGYQYYPGQRDYLCRVAAKNYGLIAAQTGTGKSLMAISLMVMKAAERTLIIAPQGTLRSSESEDEEEGGRDDSMTASQWIKELARFAPHLQVWEIFSYDDYKRIKAINGGALPPGCYVTYYEAMFINKAQEQVPDSWDDTKLAKFLKTKFDLELPPTPPENAEKRYWCDQIGAEVNGVRSIIAPCLSTLIGHEFDAVLCDEAHKATNLDALTTHMLIRLQPKYRYALTATPIPNILSNIFSLMGWLAVPDWYKGERRNAAWPYSRAEIGRFNDTFLTVERDHTQEEIKRRESKGEWSGKCEKLSPVISSPARLLKLLKPTMSFISKEACNPAYQPPKIIDVRVPFGREQAALYAHYLNRGNVPGGHPLIRARRQTAWLRNICADPAHFSGTPSGPRCSSNMNPKIISVLELVRDKLAEGEQVVIINSRKGITQTIQDKLLEAGVPVSRIDSTISPEKHSYQANIFKAKRTAVMLMGIKCAASHSFNEVKYEIISSLEYSSGPWDQAKGRIDRVNSRPGVTIYSILCKDSIEEIQYQIVAVKDDASTICLRGQRVPRDYKPVDPSETLAAAVERFDMSGTKSEVDCDSAWPKLREAIRLALVRWKAV